MKFVLDENMPLSAIDALNELGFDACHVKNELRGASDKKVAEYALARHALLITKDIEFGNLILYPSSSHYGVIILRLPYSYTSHQITEYLVRFLKAVNAAELVHALTIAELGRFRIRKLD